MSSGYGSNRTTPVGSRNQSREPSRNRDGSRGRDATSEADKRLAAAPAPTEHNPEYIDKKTKALVDEYLQIHDLKVNISGGVTRGHEVFIVVSTCCCFSLQHAEQWMTTDLLIL